MRTPPLMRSLVFPGLLFCLGLAFPASAADWPPWAKNIPAAQSAPESLVLFRGWSVTGDRSSRKIQYREIRQVGSDPAADDTVLTIGHDEFRSLSSIQIWVRDGRGKVRQLDGKKLADYGNADPREFSDDRAIIVHPPTAGPGSTIAYECEVLVSGWPRDIIQVQERLKVRRAEVRVKAAPGWTVQGWQATQEQSAPFEARTEGSWNFADVPGRSSLPNAAGQRTQTLPWMVILDWVPPGGQADFASWNHLARFFSALYPPPAGDQPRFQRLAAEMSGGGKEPISAATEAARKIRYFASEIGWGGHRPRAPETTLANGAGDCKDKALLAVSLLGQAGIQAYPVLISKVGGPPFPPGVPGDWFDHVVAGIPLGSLPPPPWATVVEAPGVGKIRLIDMTLDPGLKQDTGGLTGAWGLVLDPRTAGPFLIPPPPQVANQVRFGVRWTEPSPGAGTVHFQVEYQGYFAQAMREKSAAEQRSTISRSFLDRFPMAQDLDWGGCQGDEGRGVVCTFTGTYPAEIPSPGPYRTLFLGPLVNLETVALPPADEGAGIDLGWARGYGDTVALAFPGRRLVRAPRALEVENPSGRAALKVATFPSAIEITRELHLFGGHAGAEQASALRALREALREINAAAVLLAPGHEPEVPSGGSR